MWPFKRSAGKEEGGGTAVLGRPVVQRPTEITDDFPGTTQELFEEIDRLGEQNRADPKPEKSRHIVRLRHLAGIRLLVESGRAADHPTPDFDRLPAGDPLPEIQPAELTPDLLRAGILRDGCILVRGLVDRGDAEHFAAEIERAYTERERFSAGETPADGYYDEFEPEDPFTIEVGVRAWVAEGGGLLAVDAPNISFEMFELFRAARLRELVGGYLGEAPTISFHKTTLRKALPEVPGAWHQDGKFMGDVRSLNLWLSLCRCGDEAPSLDIVPHRLDRIVTTETEEAVLDYQVSQKMAEEAAGDVPIIRPIFEPGDALFFDEMFLHKTGSDPSMPKPRYALENWFFGPSAFPGEYAPIAV